MTITELHKLNQEELMDFWHKVYIHPVRTARSLFPDRPRGYVTATRALGTYAANRAAFLRCKEKGSEEGMFTYRKCCEVCAEDLPEWAR